jgi:glyoxylase-like metal-dependent hydrolase (beta-lactamase superfamily II)
MSAATVATSRLTRRLLAPNAGPMTLDGTNSYLLAAPGAAASVIVDPGPLDEAHLAELAAVPVELILVTHHHADHTAGAARLASLTGAPVRALDPAYCIGGEPLRDGEHIVAAGVDVRVVATPGHTADSVCFLLADDAPVGVAHATGAGAGSVLTGDTILGRGSTVIAHPNSTLADYLASLDTLAALGPALVLPGHGPSLPSLVEVCAQYREHRMQRLGEVRAALAVLERELYGAPALDEAFVARVTAIVYPDVDRHILPAAEASVRAQLVYLLG